LKSHRFLGGIIIKGKDVITKTMSDRKYSLAGLPPDASEAWRDYGDRVVIIPSEDFCFNENLKYLARSENECMYRVADNKVYKLLLIEGQEVLIELSSPDDFHMNIRFLEDVPCTKYMRDLTAKYIWDWFDLGTDLRPFYKMAASDPLLKSITEKHHGLRLIGVPNLFEAIVWSIVGQQVNLTFAYRLKRRIVEHFGRSHKWNGEQYWLFPNPCDIAAAPIAFLRTFQLTQRKCEYLIEAAKRVSEGTLSIKALQQSRSVREAEQLLCATRGIGPWSANYVLMRCLREPEAFPVEDVGLQNAVKTLLGQEKKPTPKEIRELGQRFGKWKSYATFYLWMVLYAG
jgi:DNA-3-methyladenine glycosylase II